MNYVKKNFLPTEYHTWEYKDRHRYNLQNDLLKEENFPLHFYQTEDGKQGDFVDSFYEDRARGWKGFYDNVNAQLKDKIKRGWVSMSSSDVLEMLQNIYPDKNVVGFRLVRYTNVSSGYPCDRLDVFGKADDTPKMEYGRNIAYNDCPEAKEDRCDMWGYSYYERY